MALFKSISRMFSSAGSEPAVYLSAFGKHPGWNDHLDDQGLDTASLVTAKRLLYVQGISQNIDAGAWDKLEPGERVEAFRHDFLWYMPGADGAILLAGRLWSSSDGKGRDKYPMVLCAQTGGLADSFAGQVVLPFLATVHQECASATSATTVQEIISREREVLRGRMKDAPSAAPITARQLAAAANHPDMRGLHEGFHRIVYQFVRGLGAFHTPAAKANGPRRPEQLRLPDCGMPSPEGLLFWLRFALTFVDPSTPMLLIAPDREIVRGLSSTAGMGECWVDLIAGEPSPANIYCIKAGPKQLPFTSEIPYTLDPSLTRAIDTHLAHCASMPEGAPMPAWPMLQ